MITRNSILEAVQSATKIVINHRSQRSALLRQNEFRLLARSQDVAAAKLQCGYSVVVPTFDRVVGTALFMYGEFERLTIHQVSKILEERGMELRELVFLDLGANLGSASLEAIARGFGSAIAVEPSPSNARLIRSTCALNGLADRIQISEFGVADRVGDLWLVESSENSGDNVVVGSAPPDGAVSVRVLPVPDLLTELGVRADAIGLVWIDVQGLEPDVLRGMVGMPACPVVMEFTPEEWGDHGTRSVVRILEESGAMWADLGAMSDRPFVTTARTKSPPIWREPAELLGANFGLSKKTHTDLLIVPETKVWEGGPGDALS